MVRQPPPFVLSAEGNKLQRGVRAIGCDMGGEYVGNGSVIGCFLYSRVDRVRPGTSSSLPVPLCVYRWFQLRYIDLFTLISQLYLL